MEHVNRMAVVIFVREPFVDWLNSVDPDHPVWVGTVSDRGNVYLIPEFDNLDEAEEYIEDIFDEIFTNELSDWHEDVSFWPADRTYEMFLEWFDVLYDVSVFDTIADADEDAHN